MTEEQNKRHCVLPGLTGLAQCNGRNNMTWEEKFLYDTKYIETGITFKNDALIVIKTFFKVLERDGITESGMETAMDYGDYLLKKGLIGQEEYDAKQCEARTLLGELV